MQVTVSHLQKNFKKTEALKDVSFTFGENQIFGFVGPNGAGKTTTLRILASLEMPTAGDCFIAGLSITQFPDKIRHLIGYMPDMLPSQNDISVLEYIDFFARAYGLKGAGRRDSIQGVVEFTGLENIRHKTLSALSKGMKQRVSLARALVHDPQVLLLDEPAAGLDPRARVELNELLKILAGQGKAILISSHILAELTEICHGAIIIEQGRILKSGTMADLLEPDDDDQNPLFRFLIRAYGEAIKQTRLLECLLEMPNVKSACPSGNAIAVTLAGEAKEGSLLLTELIRRGHLIAEFKPQNTNLGDVFMQVTKGCVQ